MNVERETNCGVTLILLHRPNFAPAPPAVENVKEVLKLTADQKGVHVPMGELTVYLDGLTVADEEDLAPLTNGGAANGNSELYGFIAIYMSGVTAMFDYCKVAGKDNKRETFGNIPLCSISVMLPLMSLFLMLSQKSNRTAMPSTKMETRLPLPRELPAGKRISLTSHAESFSPKRRQKRSRHMAVM